MTSAVASRYGRALADAVVESKSRLDPRKALEELRAFLEIVRTSPDLKTVLMSPAVPPARKRAALNRFAAMVPLSPLVRNFLFVLADRRRIGLLEDTADAFEAAIYERMGIVRAEVQSAAPLSERQRADLQQELSGITSKQVRCNFSVDPSLIGGVVARIGSTVYDGSVRSQLETLRERLIAG